MSRPGREAQRYTRDAKLDIRDAAAWFHRTYSPAVAQKFLRAVSACVAHIAEFPEAHELIYRNVRKAVVQGVPYSVFYEYEGSGVTVLAVMHWRRDPRDWQVRVK